MKSVLISTHPVWCREIIRGLKTLELKKSYPKVGGQFKCYIYCTLNGSNELFRDVLRGDVALWNREKWADKKGNVIGEFVCDYIMRHCEMANADLAERPSRVSREKIYEYSNGKEVYGWHISNLKIYDTPKPLSEFGLTRAPQSWCYVEGGEG